MKTKEAVDFIEWAKDVFHISNTSEKENIEFIEKGNEVIKLLQEKDSEAWEKELDEYIKTDEHKYQCASWSEGLECCLSKKFIRNFIRRLLKDVRS